MNLECRIRVIKQLFDSLERTSSRNEKEWLIQSFSREDSQLAADITFALEILDGRHKLGYTFFKTPGKYREINYEGSLQEFLKPLYEPKFLNKFDEKTILIACESIPPIFQQFVDNLVNRKYRLGIGASQLTKTKISPMLGKKLDFCKLAKSSNGYFITEKLDGNRCTSQYNYSTDDWEFFSRSGKPLRVKFNMSMFPKDLVFDGEIMQRKALEGSKSQQVFNETSGIINSKYGSKSDLVYVIFDIIDTEHTYEYRRNILNGLQHCCNEGVRILPLLAAYSTLDELEQNLQSHLQLITSRGGEGLMINLGDRPYEQKRTDGLLKVKEVQTMDMKVIDLLAGTGKNEGLVGALECFCEDAEGRKYSCRVGSGLSDSQRFNWAEHPEQILGKIVEVAYFSISQDVSTRGSNNYSLRFPRLKGIRTDKNSTSEY